MFLPSNMIGALLSLEQCALSIIQRKSIKSKLDEVELGGVIGMIPR